MFLKNQILRGIKRKEDVINILEISAFYHDSAACLVRDGKIVLAAQEWRFTMGIPIIGC